LRYIDDSAVREIIDSSDCRIVPIGIGRQRQTAANFETGRVNQERFTNRQRIGDDNMGGVQRDFIKDDRER
jgi:hypothetical protein